jgi:hypothetical protein
MREPGWLAEVWPGKAPALAKELLARWPARLPKDIRVEALANRLRNTDAGKCPRGWWEEHAPLVPVLADIVGRPEAEVQAWVEQSAPPTPSTWAPPGLRSITGATVGDPPPGLWNPRLTDWVQQLERGEKVPLHVWTIFEPVVAGDWMKEWFEHRDWRVVRAASWAEAARKLRSRGRTFVHLTGPRPPDVTPPTPPRGATVCVAASYSVRQPGVRTTVRWSAPGGWGETEVPSAGAWAVLDAPMTVNLQWFTKWFLERCRREHKPGDAALQAILASIDPSSTPGEVLLRLDVAAEDDPLAALLERIPEVTLDTLVGIEREAARRGVGLRRTLEVWESLVPGGRSPDATLADVQRAFERKNSEQARKLVEGRPGAVVRRLVEQRLLHPCAEADAPAATWRIWPRWLGARLAERAVGELASKSESVGWALLAGEDGARRGLAELDRLVEQQDWDRARERLGADMRTGAGLASVEGMALTLGLRFLDGSTVPKELATTAVAALAAAREASGGGRLLPHGDGAAGEVAALMADWALGHRASSGDPRFGPWAGEDLTPAHQASLTQLRTALDRWTSRRSAHRDVSREDATEATRMAARVFRLGTLLFEAKGVLPVAVGSQEVLWPFQVPAVLRALSAGAQVLPGMSVDEQVQAWREAADRRTIESGGESSFAAEVQRELSRFEPEVRTFFGRLARDYAASLPDPQTRKRAIEQLTTTTSANFALVRAEVESRGGSFLDVGRWLWERWNEVQYVDSTLPPIGLLRDAELDGARAIWLTAPPVVSPQIWREASREPALWDVLPAAGWRAWASVGIDAKEGWLRIPSDVLESLLGSDLIPIGYAAAWHRVPQAVLRWLIPRVRRDIAPDSTERRCLDVAPSSVVPDILHRAPPDALPHDWLQRVVTRRADGWRDAWRRMQPGSCG